MGKAICSAEDCERTVLARGMCGKHYERWRSRLVTRPQCSVDGCQNAGIKAGMCRSHYARWRTYGDPLAGAAPHVHYGPLCTVPGCGKVNRGRGLCAMHYRRLKLYGDLNYRSYDYGRKACSVPGCERKHCARGYCRLHWTRWRQTGRLETTRALPGSGSITASGYRILFLPGAPGTGKYGRIPEHRHVMQQMLGRLLDAGETVHHKNGDRLDNRPENLELWVSDHSPGQRVEDLLTWAHQIIARYGALYADQADQRDGSGGQDAACPVSAAGHGGGANSNAAR